MKLIGAKLTEAILENAHLWSTNLCGADLQGANLKAADLNRANLSGADLQGAYLEEANLFSANLKGANLQRAKLSRALLDGADFTAADLTCASLNGAALEGAILERASLEGAGLESTTLGQTNLEGANLEGAHIRWANLWQTKLSGANLQRADLFGANIRWASLDMADLSGASLEEANISTTFLRGATFRRSRCQSTVFANVDLRRTVGLDEVFHDGPSTIGIDTLYRSHGEIPETFMRGCGVPDEFIAFARSLVGKVLEFYSCFISYSTKDQAFAERLHADLQSKSVRCWFAPEDVQGGKQLHTQIDDAIRTHEKLLLLLSEHSMNSPWVQTEIRRARKHEATRGKRILFPIRLCPFEAIRDWECFDADSGKDLAVEIREYFVPDFSCWKDHDMYKKGFDRLLRDLKPDLAPVPG